MLSASICMYAAVFPILVTDKYDCSVRFPKTNDEMKASVVMLYFLFALHLQYMSQGHHCSPLLKCRIKCRW